MAISKTNEKNYGANEKVITEFDHLMYLLSDKYMKKGNSEYYLAVTLFSDGIVYGFQKKSPSQYFAFLYKISNIAFEMTDNNIKGGSIIINAVDVMFNHVLNITGKYNALSKMKNEVK